jgi:adenylate cyclase
VDPSRDGGGGLTATGLFCGSCGTKLTQTTRPAEYKQVTVLFADVVHSMDIAAAVGSERLREIMAQLLGRATEVVQRYDGTLDKFTGDGMVEVPPQAGPPRTRAPTSSDRTGVLHREDRE